MILKSDMLSRPDNVNRTGRIIHSKHIDRPHAATMTDTCRLYLITPPELVLATFADSLAAAFDGGDVACVQLRLKGTDDDTIRAAIDNLMPLCHAREVALIVNDRPDLAAACGADGVHIGADDSDYASARGLVGDDAIVGVSCYDSRHLAIEAGEAGADASACERRAASSRLTCRARV